MNHPCSGMTELISKKYRLIQWTDVVLINQRVNLLTFNHQVFQLDNSVFEVLNPRRLSDALSTIHSRGLLASAGCRKAMVRQCGRRIRDASRRQACQRNRHAGADLSTACTIRFGHLNEEAGSPNTRQLQGSFAEACDLQAGAESGRNWSAR